MICIQHHETLLSLAMEFVKLERYHSVIQKTNIVTAINGIVIGVLPYLATRICFWLWLFNGRSPAKQLPSSTESPPDWPFYVMFLELGFLFCYLNSLVFGQNVPKPRLLPTSHIKYKSTLLSPRPATRSIFSSVPEEIPPKGKLFSCSEAICYDDVGCFEPWTMSFAYGLYRNSVCPWDPESIGTRFFIFRSDSPDEAIDAQEIQDSDKIIIFVHGYKNSYNESKFLRIKNKLLEHVDIVVMVDYSRGGDPKISSRSGFHNFYQAAVNGQVVGRVMTNFVEDLRQQNHVNPEKIHLIGYSLGSHVIHFAADFAIQEYSFHFGRITCKQLVVLITGTLR